MTKRRGGKHVEHFLANVHLDVRSLLLLPKCQSAQKVEESADLLGCEVVHVVQDSLCQTLCSVKNSAWHNETKPL